MKRINMFLAVFLLVAIAWPSTANAALKFFKVNVDIVGMITVGGTEVVQYRLTEVGNSPTFTFQRFLTITSTVKKAMLATALTAMAAGLPVVVFTDPDDGASPEVFRLLVASE